MEHVAASPVYFVLVLLGRPVVMIALAVAVPNVQLEPHTVAAVGIATGERDSRMPVVFAVLAAAIV